MCGIEKYVPSVHICEVVYFNVEKIRHFTLKTTEHNEDVALNRIPYTIIVMKSNLAFSKEFKS